MAPPAYCGCSVTSSDFDSFQFADTPVVSEVELRSQAVPNSQSFDGFLKWKGISRLEWDWQHLNIGIAVNYRDGFHEIARSGSEHWVQQTWFFDVQASYDFSSLVRIELKPVPGYSKNAERTLGGSIATDESGSYHRFGWRALLDGTSVTLGCTDVFGQDPPRALVNYPRTIYDPTGRFVYVSLTKKFW